MATRLRCRGSLVRIELGQPATGKFPPSANTNQYFGTFFESGKDKAAELEELVLPFIFFAQENSWFLVPTAPTVTGL